MHEYAIAEGVLGVVEDHAGGRRVEAVELKVGQLRQVVPAALELAFEIAAEDTIAAGAELRLESVRPLLLCAACAEQTETAELPLACAGCGGFEVTVLAGEELQVESIEVSDERAPRAEPEEVA